MGPCRLLYNLTVIASPKILEQVFSFGTEAEKSCISRVSKAWNEIVPPLAVPSTVTEGDDIVSPPIVSREWLFHGTQEGCSGTVAVAEAESIRTRLNADSTSGIRFNPDKISGYIDGGTCSAMSLELLSDYFQARKINEKHFRSRSSALLYELTVLGKKFATSSEEFRNRQAAFNTIEVLKHEELLGESASVSMYSKNKVQALANLHSLVVNYSSKEIDTAREGVWEIEGERSSLPEGAYLIRTLKPSSNEKLEEFGHSMVYINENGLSLFYDPNVGLKNLKAFEPSIDVAKSIKGYFSIGLTKATFHRIVPK